MDVHTAVHPRLPINEDQEEFSHFASNAGSTPTHPCRAAWTFQPVVQARQEQAACPLACSRRLSYVPDIEVIYICTFQRNIHAPSAAQSPGESLHEDAA